MYNQLYLDDLKQFVTNEDLQWLNNKSILLSGGTGLIGSYLVDALLFNPKLNVKICVLVRNKQNAMQRFDKHTKDKRLCFYEQNLLETISINENFDYVLHLASFADPKNYAAFPVETMLTNFIGCKNMLDVCCANHARFFLSSSCEIYGVSADKMVESNLGAVDTMDPRSCYNESKRAAETLCASYAKEYKLDFVIGRLCRVFGPTMKMDDSKALSQFLKAAINKQDIILKSKGYQKYSYIYVADAVKGILTCLHNGVSGEAYNISYDDKVWNLKTIASYIAQLESVKVIFQLPTSSEQHGYSRAKNAILPIEKIKEIGYKCNYKLDKALKTTLDIIKFENKKGA